VTCLCPTYGRIERLRDAVACFLLQDYASARADGAEATLLILNDAPVAITLGGRRASVPGVASADTLAEGLNVSPRRRVFVVNWPGRFPTLGHKRQALLEMAWTAVVAHWDDDDLYLPWHLSMCVSTLLERRGMTCAKPSASCVKAQAAWWVTGPREGPFDNRGIHHNVFEGQMVFDRDRALELGGYPPVDSGQAKALLDAFGRAGELHTWNPADEDVSYVYRWGDGADHVSSRKACPPGRAAAGQDADFGDGRPLIPDGDPRTWARARLHEQFRGLARGVQGHISRAPAQALIGVVHAAVAPPLARPAGSLSSSSNTG